MPKFTFDKLNQLVGPENEQALGRKSDRPASGLVTALGGLGLGEVRLPGIDTGQTDITFTGEHLSRTQGIDMIADLEIKQIFEKSIAASCALYERVGIIAPDVSDLMTKGVDFPGLADIYQAECDAGREPELVYAPINVSLVQVKNLFANLCHDASISDNPLKTHSGGSDGVLVTREVITNWTLLTGSIVLPRVELVVGQTQYDSWSLRIIPGTSVSPVLELDHEGYDSRDFLMQAPHHPTLVEYITIQGTRIQAGRRLLDHDDKLNYNTWLNGSFEHEGNTWAPYGSFAMGRVMLAIELQEAMRSRLGTREARW